MPAIQRTERVNNIPPVSRPIAWRLGDDGVKRAERSKTPFIPRYQDTSWSMVKTMHTPGDKPQAVRG